MVRYSPWLVNPNMFYNLFHIWPINFIKRMTINNYLLYIR